MSNEVYANGNEVSCKAAAGKSIAAFPDVCFTPPLTPATPPGVPIPYPNTGMASDTSGGSKTVQISGKEVMKKDSSYFKTSTGDEAGSAPKKNVITSKIKGKCYYTAWSMDVKVEGENVVRHLDLMTHNHASNPGATPPWVYADMMAFGNVAGCEAEVAKVKRECRGAHAGPGGCTDACKEAKACLLVAKKDDKKKCCHPENTGHHMIEDHWVTGNAGFPSAQSNAGYQGAPCVCVNRYRSQGNHQSMHNVQGVIEESFKPGGTQHVAGQPSGGFTYDEGKRATFNAHDATFTSSNCDRDCLNAQIDSYYGNNGDRPLNPPGTQPLGSAREQTLEAWGPSVSG